MRGEIICNGCLYLLESRLTITDFSVFDQAPCWWCVDLYSNGQHRLIHIGTCLLLWRWLIRSLQQSMASCNHYKSLPCFKTRAQRSQPPYPTPTSLKHFVMIPKRFITVLALALCLIAASAAPAPATPALIQSNPDVAVRANVEHAINKEIGKASRTFNLSRTAIIAIVIGCAVAVILLVFCLICCCCGCCK